MPLLPLAVRNVIVAPWFRRALRTVGPVVASMLLEAARRQQWRQVALTHARALDDGRVSVVPGETPSWLVWDGDEAVAAYPAPDGGLAALARTVDLDARLRPEEVPGLGDRLRQITAPAGGVARRVGRGAAHLVGRVTGAAEESRPRVEAEVEVERQSPESPAQDEA